ncbi:MAG TPA: Ppx/GppA family phosphatase, partial [Solirubrobacteraceae bacterium]
MRVAVVDIGSNSTRLLIAEIAGDRVQSELDRRSIVTRLGQGVDADGRLSREAIDRVYETLEEYQAEIDRRGVERSVAVLTSAVRDSANGEEFADTVRERYGLDPHVLSGDQEAEMTFRGATSERDRADVEPTLVFDIGGGSTEIVIGTGTAVVFHVSTQAGVVRQTERHLHHDPPREAEQAQLSADVRETLADAVPEQRRDDVTRGIAVAGTA